VALVCVTSAEDHDHGPGGNEQSAGDSRGGEFFAQQQPGQQHDQRNAQLVERGHARGRAELQGAKVAQPRKARGQAGEGEKQDGAAVERAYLWGETGAGPGQGQSDAPGKDHHYCSAQGHSQVRIHMRHAHLGQQGGGGGKDRGEQCPSNPAHEDHGTRARGPGRVMPSFKLQGMETGRASKTALRVAIRRAAHQLMDHPPVLNDPIAVKLVGEGFARDMERAQHKVARDFRAFMAVRSRYVEDQLALAVAQGVRQYVVLGAGLDTFAWRNPFAELRVFEVDFPATQEWKRGVLAEAGLVHPPGLTFVPLDFEHKALAAGLDEAGFDAGRPAFFGWLGVVPYLTREAFRATLGDIAGMPAGSGVGFDYGLSPEALGPLRRLALKALSERVASAGEPFKLLFTPEELEHELRQAGFMHIEQRDGAQLNALYFQGRSDELKLPDPGLGMLVTAWV